MNLQQQELQHQTPTKHSMLGKLKIFSNKDKQHTECPKTQLSKRTSSSSGFSSARSERSDSSLSLNNDTSSNIPTSQSSSSNKSMASRKSDAAKVTTKISKVPAPTAIKSKGEKKDKSQLSENNNNGNTNGDIVSPTKVHKIPQAKLQVPVGRKSVDSKTGLTSSSTTAQQHQQAVKSVQSVSTGIPKPMAAIKGTTKQQSSTETILQVSSDENFDVIKVEKVMNISVQNNNESGVILSQKTQIVNPLNNNNSINNNISDSPLHNQLLNQTNNNNITSTMTDGVHLTSTSAAPSATTTNNSTETVIYRSSLNEVGGGGGDGGGSGSLHTTDIYQLQTNLIQNRKLENFNDPFNSNKFGTMPIKVSNGMVQTSIAATIIEEDREVDVTSTMSPMRSLMRGGFNNHLSSSPSRLNHVTASNGYYDENGHGYSSDDQSFRKSTIRYSDIENGYLSEGPHFLSILRNRPQLPSTIAEER